eukprot:jgi/Hompol1/1248/HPOL_001764-RA
MAPTKAPSPAAATAAPESAAAAAALLRKATLRTVVVALIIDLLAFTIILPLFPRLIAHYEIVDGGDPTSFYYSAAALVRRFREAIGGTGSRLDIVLFGGMLGSMFSLLQFISSPIIGKLSDQYGRRNVLLLSMIGNAISTLLWIFSGSFPVFVMSRIVGGLTEGNVQMSIAIISDITPPSERSKNLAWVGISFALAFTLGPPLGAYLCSFDLHKAFPDLPINNYSSPALFAFVLIIIETAYLFLYLPETNNVFKASQTESVDPQGASKKTRLSPSSDSARTSNQRLAILSLVHFVFLFSFSGMEFTLTFLTHDRFDFTHGQQGRLLAFMGILSAAIQGGYVRRVAHKYVSEQTLVFQGILSCAIGLAIVGQLATTTTWLYTGAAFLAFTSGTVVGSLTSLASLVSSSEASSSKSDSDGLSDLSEHADDNRGHLLGKFRSMGQLGRSMGPLVACSGYWIIGSQRVYLLAAVAMLLLAIAVHILLPQRPLRSKTKQE